MNCPHCDADVSLWQLVKFKILMAMPHSYYTWRDRREQDSELAKLKRLYNYYSSKTLTVREHMVCTARSSGQTLEEVARTMNVTRERVRQIQAKAVRKLERSES